MNATAAARTDHLWKRGVALAAVLALLSWSFFVVSSTIAEADHVDPGDPHENSEEGLPTTTHGVQPVLLAGNQNCAEVAEGDFEEFRIEPVEAGTHEDPDSDFEVVLTIPSEAPPPGVDPEHSFDFEVTSAHVVTDVAVKGGPDTHWYPYDHEDGDGNIAGPAGEDTFLTAPRQAGEDRFFGLSHISFCFVPDEPVEPVGIGALEVAKEVTGEPDGDEVFGFEVDCADGEFTAAPTLEDGESWHSVDDEDWELPDGTECTVTERDSQDADEVEIEVEPADAEEERGVDNGNPFVTVTIAEDTTVTVTFTNHFEPVVEEAVLDEVLEEEVEEAVLPERIDAGTGGLADSGMPAFVLALMALGALMLGGGAVAARKRL